MSSAETRIHKRRALQESTCVRITHRRDTDVLNHTDVYYYRVNKSQCGQTPHRTDTDSCCPWNLFSHEKSDLCLFTDICLRYKKIYSQSFGPSFLAFFFGLVDIAGSSSFLSSALEASWELEAFFRFLWSLVAISTKALKACLYLYR